MWFLFLRNPAKPDQIVNGEGLCSSEWAILGLPKWKIIIFPWSVWRRGRWCYCRRLGLWNVGLAFLLGGWFLALGFRAPFWCIVLKRRLCPYFSLRTRLKGLGRRVQILGGVLRCIVKGLSLEIFGSGLIFRVKGCGILLGLKVLWFVNNRSLYCIQSSLLG